MFENVQNSLNGVFGKIGPGMCRLTTGGNIAVKCGNTYKTYNVKKETLTNVTNFCFSLGDEMFFVVPTMKVEVGDIILVGGKPKCVTKVTNKKLTVIDYETSEEKIIVPERHIFMGNAYFYGKIVSMFGNSIKKGKGLSRLVKMMMLSHMIGGNNGFSQMMGNNNSANNGGNGFAQMMAMSMLAPTFMGKDDDDAFDGIFDFDLGFADGDDEEDSHGDSCTGKVKTENED